MDEYIEREAAIESIMSEPPDAHYPQWYADKIKAIPASDVEPVRHGRWKRYSTTMMECSLCGKHTARHKFNYCPNCGAKMDLEGDK